MKEFVAKFEALVQAGKLQEAKELLSTFGSLPETDEEQAETKLFLADLYVRLSNAVNESYLAALDGAIKKLKALDAKEKEIDEKVTLAKTRASLAR